MPSCCRGTGKPSAKRSRPPDPRRPSLRPWPDAYDEGEERGAELVVSGRDPPELLQLVEEPLDQIAFTIEFLAEWVQDFAVGFIGNIGRCALRLDVRADPVRIITLVSKHDGPAFEVLQQISRACRVVVLTRCNQEAERAAFFVDERMDFRGEPASATTHATISTPFFAPAACW